MHRLTARIAGEILAHEAIVREAYRDSGSVWTWGVGVTEASGHGVHPRYCDKPQTLRWCLEAYLRLLRENYLPCVLETFDGFELSEAELGAALSFHYNTGGIQQAAWVEEWQDGDVDGARNSFMNWRKPPQIIGRREKERDLFFDGIWSSDGCVMEYSVIKPSYAPDPESGVPIHVAPILQHLLGD